MTIIAIQLQSEFFVASGEVLKYLQRTSGYKSAILAPQK